MEEELRDLKHTKHTITCFISFQMPNREFPSCAPVDLSRRSSSTKRIHMTTSLGKDTSSAKTTRMTGCISGNHGLWVCNKRFRGSNNGFMSRRSFCESARRLRPRLR
ncbi:hypothetical protein HID58_077869 [Brassica napus]|uniref:Uncharacterized protein n=1 Tax=Brassica napus TaxID=3708 RepID=A0ABQ7YRV7_BRANA|nr:hypothetical protein HID58_077869 [Brassica napus]